MSEEIEKKRNHLLYFGRTMPFTDNHGNVYAGAFNVVDYSVDIINKELTLRSIFFKSIESFEAGEPPISKADGGIIGEVYTSDQWDAFMIGNAQLVSATALRVHEIFGLVKLTPKTDGGFESFFAQAGPIILPESE